MYSDCTRCVLGDYVRSTGGRVCVPADERRAGLSGTPTDILVVGQNPGKTENKTGIPFTGDSGKVRVYLEATKCTYAITNAVKCHSPNNREPLLGEASACSVYLMEEIRRYNPKVILALGNSALHALTGHKGIAKARNVPQDLRAPFRLALGPTAPKVLCTKHPASALRYPQEWGLIAEDIEAVTRYIARDWNAPEALKIDEREVLPAVPRRTRLTFDLESSTADYRSAKYSLFLCGFKQVDEEEVRVYRDVTRLPLLSLVTGANENEIVSFNGLSFDEPALLSQMAWRGPKPMHYDVMLIAYLVDETMKLISLQSCATRWLGVAPWKEEGRVLWDKKIKLARRPENEEEWSNLVKYNARDVIYTERLFDVLWPKLDTQQQRLYKYLMMPAARELNAMWENGLPIDKRNIVEAKMRCSREMQAAEEDIDPYLRRFGYGDFNLDSTQQVAELLYEHLGLPVLKRTEESKNPSTDQETLKRLVERGCEPVLCNAMLRRRKYKRLDSGTLMRFFKLLEEDGRAHLPYHLVRTETGRTSGPTQQIPRQPWMRRIVKAKPGYKLISADQSQIEVRTMSWRSREPTMLELFRTGQDVHWRMALNVNRAETLRLAELYRLWYGIPASRTGGEVLSRLLQSPCSRTESSELLLASCANGEDTESWRGEWERTRRWAVAPLLDDGWAKFFSSLSGDELREVQQHQVSLDSPQGPQQDEQQPFQFRDAVQALSSNRARVLAQFPEWGERRSLSKALVFGTLYGAEAYTLQTSLFTDSDIVISHREAVQLREAFLDTFSGLIPYYNQRIEETKQTGIVRSPFGRIRHLENIKAWDREIATEAARKAINTDNQSDASDITLVGLILARQQAPWLKAVHFGHDCNVFEVPDERVDEAVAIIPKAMTDDTLDYIADHFGFMIDVPLQVDCKVSEEWSCKRVSW